MGTRSKRAAALVVAIAALGCLPGTAGTAGVAASSSPEVDLRIRIAASARTGAPARTWRLRCDPNGGNWPSVGLACGRLTTSLLSPFELETRDFVRITSQPVRISGRAFGRTVALRFPAMGSGTRHARLRMLRSALGASAFRQAERRSRA